MKIKFDQFTIQQMASFEAMTKARLKDLIEFDDMIYFVVEAGQLYRAIGKQAANVKRLRTKLTKNFKIVEYHENLEQFIKNCIFPIKIVSFKQEGGIVTIEGEDRNAKGLLIGRNASNLRLLEKVIQRYFKIEEIKVI